MWQTISNVLTSTNGLQTLIVLVIIIIIVAVLAKVNILNINTKYLHFGMSSSDKERTIIREQIDWVHTYLHGLESKIRDVPSDHTLIYGGYFTKYILEIVFDEIVKWITFNNIENSERYVTVKQDKICSLVYGQDVREEYHTKEFNQCIRQWVEEIIKKLIEIRKLYS